MKKYVRPKVFAADNFRRDAKRLIRNYGQRSTMVGDAVIWTRIVERYESLLPAEMRKRAKVLGS
jgi:hypothetical protein